MAVVNQQKPQIGYNQQKGKSHWEMCSKDIEVDCHVRNDRMQPSHSHLSL